MKNYDSEIIGIIVENMAITGVRGIDKIHLLKGNGNHSMCNK
jgi:hypothetical protein